MSAAQVDRQRVGDAGRDRGTASPHGDRWLADLPPLAVDPVGDHRSDLHPARQRQQVLRRSARRFASMRASPTRITSASRRRRGAGHRAGTCADRCSRSSSAYPAGSRSIRSATGVGLGLPIARRLVRVAGRPDLDRHPAPRDGARPSCSRLPCVVAASRRRERARRRPRRRRIGESVHGTAQRRRAYSSSTTSRRSHGCCGPCSAARDTRCVPPRKGSRRWQISRSWPPELVITDLYMPHMDGVELCRRIREIVDGADHRPVGKGRGADQGRGARLAVPTTT